MILTILGLLTIGWPAVVWAQPDAPSSEDLRTLRNEIQALKEGQQAIQQQLKDIQKLLTARAQPRSNVQDVTFTVNVAKDPAKGPADAKVTLIEFTDYQCPYCARHIRSVLPQLTKYFIDTGKIRYVLRDFPWASIHKDAAKAHEAAHCAGEQGKYWEMHHQLFAHPKELQADKLAGHAQTAHGLTSRAIRHSTADATGTFRFTQLGPGRHTLNVSAPGYTRTLVKHEVGPEQPTVQVTLAARPS